jgi:hypothetical protein
MNPDFSFVDDSRKVKDGVELITRVCYKGECIAVIAKRFEPSEKGKKNNKIAIDFEHIAPEEYVQTYGYMAEHRRRWNNGDRVNWSEDLRVQV